MKESFYFTHDYNPTEDLKVSAMLTEFGGMGYGLFWRLIELLHSEESHKLAMKQYTYIALAKQMLTSVEHVLNFIKQCIEVYELFESDGNFFWSNRVFRNFERRNDIKEKRAKAGKASADKRKLKPKPTSVEQVSTSVEQVSTSVEHNLTDCNKEKEKKVKEIKEKESTISSDEFEDFEELAFENPELKNQNETEEIHPHFEIKSSELLPHERMKGLECQTYFETIQRNFPELDIETELISWSGYYIEKFPKHLESTEFSLYASFNKWLGNARLFAKDKQKNKKPTLTERKQALDESHARIIAMLEQREKEEESYG